MITAHAPDLLSTPHADGAPYGEARWSTANQRWIVSANVPARSRSYWVRAASALVDFPCMIGRCWAVPDETAARAAARAASARAVAAIRAAIRADLIDLLD